MLLQKLHFAEWHKTIKFQPQANYLFNICGMFVKFLIIFNYEGTDSIFLLKTLLDLNKGLTRISDKYNFNYIWQLNVLQSDDSWDKNILVKNED